tara:strand:+ start:997 stop:1692 length:696 start_codon:yes stop_codon:yes gene_type:complete
MATNNEPGCGAVFGFLVLGIFLLTNPVGWLIGIIGVIIWLASQSNDNNNVSSYKPTTNVKYKPIQGANGLQQVVPADYKSPQEKADELRKKEEAKIKMNRIRIEERKREEEEKRKKDFRKRALMETIESCEAAAEELVQKHKVSLHDEKRRLETQNPYGVKNESAWLEEKGKGFDFFYKKVFQASDFYPVFIDACNELRDEHGQMLYKDCRGWVCQLCETAIKEVDEDQNK